MGRRFFTFALTAAALLGVVRAAAGRSEATPLAPGDPAPALLAASARPVTIAWTFRADDLLSCSTAALSLRHVQAQFGDRVELVAVAVGPDPGLVSSFLRRERLDARVQRMDVREHAREFGPALLPSLYIITAGRVAETTSDSTWADGTKRRERPIARVVGNLLDGVARAGSLSATPTPLTEREQ